jgi:ATP-dependent Clp protease adaptor protein ClpS
MGNNSKSSAATVEEVQTKSTPEATKQTESRNKPKHLPPYKVLLHNDEVNTFEHVITSIVKLTTLSTQEAIIRTLEAHESGLALLLTTHRERAELFIEQFASLSLKTTAEPAE